MVTLECWKARNKPPHRKGWQSRDAQRFLKTSCAHPLGRCSKPLQHRADFVEQSGSCLRRYCIPACAQEKLDAKPLLECPDLPAYCAMGDAELHGREREAAKARGCLEGLDCVKGRQPANGHIVSFPHKSCQHNSFVIELSPRQKVTLTIGSPFAVTVSVFAAVLFAAALHAAWNAMLKGGVGDRLWAMTVMSLAVALVGAAAVPFLPWPAAASWPYI